MLFRKGKGKKHFRICNKKRMPYHIRSTAYNKKAPAEAEALIYFMR